MSIEAMKQALEALEKLWLLGDQVGAIANPAITALRQAIEQAQQVDKEGSPCPEFWEWLPKAYNFDGDGVFTKYNMEVAFLAGKQSVEQAQKQEPVRIMGFNCVCGRRMEVSAEQGVVPASRQNPVAWGVFDGSNLHDMFFTEEEAHEMARLKGDGSTVAPLYTSPPQRQPLTLVELSRIFASIPSVPFEGDWQLELARAIEAAHGIKRSA